MLMRAGEAEPGSRPAAVHIMISGHGAVLPPRRDHPGAAAQDNRDHEGESQAPRAQCLLDCFLEHPLLISSVGTILFSVSGIVSLLYEMESTCKPDLKLWLTISVGRSLVRLILRYLLELHERQIIVLRSNLGFINKMVEMLDVFGLVWFSVGNLLVFNGVNCASETPLVFLTSCIYIVCVYLYLFVPALLRLCFRTRLPQERHDRDAALFAALERMIMMDENNNANSGTGGYNLTRSTASFWRSYLRLACGLKEHASFEELSTALRAEGKECPDISFCPICLDEFGSAEPERGVGGGVGVIAAGDDDDVEAAAGGPASPLDGSSSRRNYSSLSAEDEALALPPLPAPLDCDPGQTPLDPLTPDQRGPRTLICFPCNAHHVFHTPCLLSWLESCTSKHSNPTAATAAATCPICRQALSVPLPPGPRTVFPPVSGPAPAPVLLHPLVPIPAPILWRPVPVPVPVPVSVAPPPPPPPPAAAPSPAPVSPAPEPVPGPDNA